MQLASMGKVAHSVPFCYKGVIKMSLYKGEAALDTRRSVAKALTPSLIATLQRPRHVNDKPDFAPMQQLFDAGIRRHPITGTAVFNPDNAKPSLLAAYWKADGSIAETIDTKQMGQTDKALEELQMRLHEHAAQITENKRLRPGGALAKRKRASSPAASSSDEGTDTGPPARRQRTIRPRSDDDASTTSVPHIAGSDDTVELVTSQPLPSAPQPPPAPPASPPPSPPTLSPQPSPPPSSRSVVICEGERERVIGCETVGDVLSQLASMGVDGDYLTHGRMGERLDDAERLSDIDGELWMRVRGRGGARGLDINDGGGGEGDHALEAALAFLALHEPSSRGPKATSDNRASILKRAARLRAKLAKEAQQASTVASCSQQPKKAEPKNPALPRMPRKPEHVKDPAEDAARMAEYAAQREEAIRAKATHAEQMKQRHREEQRALERARRADLADEQRRAEQEAQAAAQRERREAMPYDKRMEERFAQQQAQEARRAAADDKQRQMERDATAKAVRACRGGVTPLWNALQLPVGQREDQLLYDFHASGSGFTTVNSRRLRTLTPGSLLHEECVNTVLEEIRLRAHVTVADRARMVFAFKDRQTFGPKGSVPDARRKAEALRKDRPIISDEETRLLALAGIHPWQYRCVDNWNYCETDDFLLAAERYQRWIDTPEAKRMDIAATIISARVRGYLTRRAYSRFLCPPVLAEDAQEAPPPAIDAQLVGRTVWVLCTEEKLPARPEHYSGDWWLGGKITKYCTPDEAQQTAMDYDLQDAHFNVEWKYSDDMADWAMSSWLDLDKYDPYVDPEREPAAGAWYLEEVCP